MTPSEYVSRAEAASLYAVSERTVDRWIKAGKLPALVLPTPGGRGTVRIPREALRLRLGYWKARQGR